MGPFFPRIAYLVLLLAVGSSAGLAEAGVSPFWQELAGSASGTGVSQAPSPKGVFDGSVAVGSNGRPVVVYTEYPDDSASQGAILVKRWTGSAWETLPGSGGMNQGYEPQVQVSATGNIYVAWLTDAGSGNTEIRLRVWTGTQFTPLGSSDSAGGLSGANPGIAAPYSLALDAAGAPMAAFIGLASNTNLDPTSIPAIVNETFQIYVRQWNGSTWAFVGSDFAGGGASNARSFRSGGAEIFHDADSPWLTLDSTGAPVVAFTYFTSTAANSDVFVTRYNGSAWTAVGPAVPAVAGGAGNGGAGGVSNSANGSFNPALGAGPGGKLALAWEEEPSSGGVYTWVRVWNGTSWITQGTSASGSSFNQSGTDNVQPRIGFDSTGQPLVAWQAIVDFNEPAQIFVRRFNGSHAWEEVGFHSAREAGISDAVNDAFGFALGLVFTPAGGTAMARVPTLTWLDVQDSGTGQVFLRQLYTGPTFPLTTRVSGGGSVKSDPIGVECSTASCVASFPGGTAVTLLPQPAAGSAFTGWADGCSGNGSCTVAMTTARSVNASFATVHRLTLTATTPSGASGQGAVGGLTGPAGTCAVGAGACASDVLHGTAVVLQATSDAGNRFLNWSGGPCNGSKNSTCSFTMNAVVTTTALFRGVTGVSVAKAGNGAGTVTGPGINCGSDCVEEAFTGTTVTLTARPATGSRFLGWTGDCSGVASCVLTTAGQLNRSVTATFQLLKQRLAVTMTGAGFTTSAPGGIDCGDGHAACASDYDYGTVVSLTPFADVDSTLSAWTGCTSRNGSVCTVALTANRTITGKFVAAHTLSVTASGNGSGTISTTTAPGLTCVSNCSASQFFPATASVVLRPQPAAGTNFHWLSGLCTGSGACTTPMSQNRTAAGQFTLNRHLLGVTNRPSGHVVNLGPLPGAGIDCGNGDSLCADTYDYGTAVTLRATANPGFMFVNWTGGGCAGSNTTCAFVLKANTTVTPNFRARTLVTVTKGGTGAGTISGPGISCGADCSQAELDARPITLTASPTAGSRFVGFGDACVSSTTKCTFTPSGDSQTVTATFQLIPYTVSVANRVNGTAATTTTLPDGITCGAGNADCSATLDFGTQVVLQATPIVGSRFVNWTGNVCAGSANATCAFKIPAANVSVSPNFKDVTALTLNKSGLGAVVSSPGGLGCGTACATASFDFARGVVIRLTPTPAVGWSFSGFSGDCSGLTCSVNASAPTALVGASFSIQHRRLNVTVVGHGTVGGPGLSCDAGSTPCPLDFDYGTSLPLTATAAAGYRFTGWSQNCSGVGACSLLMTADRSVTATFKPQFGLVVTKPGNSTGTITASSSPAGVPAFSCGTAFSVCGSTYLDGQAVTLTRSGPITGTTFQWGGDCAFRGTNATCPLTLHANASVTAAYSLQRLGLTVVTNSTPLGTVTGLGGGVSCGVDCAEVVDYGTPVLLLATPSSSPAAEFVSWAGCSSAPSNPSCSLTMTANRTVTATFRPLVESLQVRALSTSTLARGGVRQLSAIATFTDGTQQDVTADPGTLWTSSAPVVVSVSTTGLLTAKAIGNSSVSATFRLHGDAIPVNVDELLATTPPATPIIVSCHAYGDTSLDPTHLACLPSGQNFSVHCEATGMFPSGSQDITDQVTWVTSSGAIAQATGLVAFNSPVRQSFRIVGNGSAVLRATLGGKTSATSGTLGTNAWVVQGAPGTVSALSVTPPSTSVQVGHRQPLVATATLTGTGACAVPPTRDFSTVVSWSSGADTVADVSFFGEVTGLGPGGPVTITATYPLASFSDTAAITVVP